MRKNYFLFILTLLLFSTTIYAQQQQQEQQLVQQLRERFFRTITHDSTLTGDGTNASPLGVAVPLRLTASLPGQDTISAINVSGAGGGNGVYGYSDTGSGVFGRSVGAAAAVTGQNTGGGIGVTGTSVTSFGVLGVSQFEAGVIGVSDNANGIGVWGALPSGGNGLAGYFFGNVGVTGTLTKGGGSFKIDHPLDPDNKYLSHSFVESPDMMNIYNGNATTDANGDAVVILPDYFASLNRDFRYQLTVIGQFAQAIVGSKIQDNRFQIKTDKPNVEVSWQVTGIRQDPWANAHRILVEERKDEKERGHYLHPELLNQSEEKGVEWAKHPELMKRIKAERVN